MRPCAALARPEFSIDLALKDLDLVGTEAGPAAAPIVGATAERWRWLVESGSSGLDVSAAGRGLGRDALRGDPRTPYLSQSGAARAHNDATQPSGV